MFIFPIDKLVGVNFHSALPYLFNYIFFFISTFNTNPLQIVKILYSICFVQTLYFLDFYTIFSTENKIIQNKVTNFSEFNFPSFLPCSYM